jgi:hypothetical protein
VTTFWCTDERKKVLNHARRINSSDIRSCTSAGTCVNLEPRPCNAQISKSLIVQRGEVQMSQNVPFKYHF